LIAYIDSSVLVRAYLVDEPDHEEVVELLSNPQMVAVTGTWTRIEVSGALVRAARAGRGDEKGLLAILDADLGIDGPVTVVSANQVDIESEALVMVRVHGLRAMDAWHLAVAGLVLPDLLEPGETASFATRDAAQADVARALGYQPL
jgi:predicted nucleic acid-binding protein